MKHASDSALAVAILLAAVCCGPSVKRTPTGPTDEVPPNPRDGKDLVDISLGNTGACGVFADRTAACWGDWDGAYFSVTVPAFTLRSVVELRSGQTVGDPQHFHHHFCARDVEGGVWCWGNNRDGQVGRGNHIDAATPDRVSLPAPAVELALGMHHSCARTRGGEVWCWGFNVRGQVSGLDATVVAPRRVEGITNATQLTAGSEWTCALDETGMVRCWGFPFSHYPSEMTDARGTRELFAGSGVKCSIMDEGRVLCWGHLKDLVGPEHHDEPAVTIAGLPPATSATSGSQYACALSADGEVWCWGRGGEGELGNGRADNEITPPARVVLPGPATKVAAGGHNTCARLEDRRWFCWGRNVGGMFGPSRPVLTPIELDLSKVRFTAN